MKFKLPYGLKDGKLVHISDVEKGLKCECVCPACNHPLIARKGEKTAHHFAHYNGSECAKSVETALHSISPSKYLFKANNLNSTE
ncbi:competence protein CoiA family protein [Neobacillus sp. WH10]|uniref:competence protein CoiA family protein n=1 Tax=Neobacillus sp. WH10 TaxID=3047873 RepID=UPI0024C1A893|nr:competence protein CoiA family protein [Neobacillus sp. WH10]WHY77279.1 competence protein CoiA family protein [Neobacillus sp. WH10]